MISQNYANKILNTLVSNNSDTLSKPTSVYFGLCKTEPNAKTGAVTDEPTADSYHRKAVGGSAVGTSVIFSSAANGQISNSAEIQMSTAKEAWTSEGEKLYYWFLSTGSGEEGNTGSTILWGEIRDKDDNFGISVPADSVPTFYEENLKISIDTAIS